MRFRKMGGQIGGIILIACITIAVLTTISTMSIQLAKEAMENYETLNFIAEPYMSSLSKLTYPTSCGNTEIYELMAYSAAQGSADFTYCGDSINLHTVIDPIHTNFQNEFGAQNFYLFIENSEGRAFFSSPQMTLNISNITVLTQMPLPLPDENVTRVVLAKVRGAQ